MNKKAKSPTKPLGDLKPMLNLKELMHYYLRNINTYFLINTYFAIFNQYLSYSYIVWAQNIDTVNRSIIFLEESATASKFQATLI